jgi:hypothetical protein
MAILELEADLYKTLNSYKELFDEYADAFSTLEISTENQYRVQKYSSGLKSMVEGLQYLQKSFDSLCELKLVPLE